MLSEVFHSLHNKCGYVQNNVNTHIQAMSAIFFQMDPKGIVK